MTIKYFLRIYTIYAILIASSCATVRQYKTSDVRKAFEGSIQKTEQSIKNIESDRNSRRSVYEKLVLLGDSTIAPYPSMNQDLADMDGAIREMHALQEKIKDLKDRFEKLAEGKSGIKSNHPEWESMQKIEDEFKAAGNNINMSIKRYHGHAEKFNDLVRQYKIRKVNVSVVQGKMRSDILSLKEKILDVKTRMMRFKEDLGKEIGATGDQKNISEKENNISAMDAIVNGISQKGDEAEKAVSLFENEARGKTEILAGPGMRTYSILEDVRKAAAEVQGLVERFNEMAGRGR
jgi:hypothetical protein